MAVTDSPTLFVTIDACVAMKWRLRDEEALTEADALLEDAIQRRLALQAPDLFDYEVANALHMAVVRNRLQTTRAETALSDYQQIQVRRLPFESVRRAAFALAQQYRRSVYDASYLAVAQVTGTVLLTGDLRLYHAVHPMLSWVCWIGDYTFERIAQWTRSPR